MTEEDTSAEPPPDVTKRLRDIHIRRRAKNIAVIRNTRRIRIAGSWLSIFAAVGVCSLLTGSVEVFFAQKGSENAKAVLRFIQVIGNISAAMGLALSFVTSYKIRSRYTFGFGAAYFFTNPAIDAAGFFKKEALLLMNSEWADLFLGLSTAAYILGTGLILCLIILAVTDLCIYVTALCFAWLHGRKLRRIRRG